MKKPVFPFLVVLALCSWFCPVAEAALVTGLYEARVPVADQSSAAHSAALQQAFVAVLVKVTGRRDAGSSLAPALGNPQQYVQQYRYEKAETAPATVQGAAPAAPQLFLWAKFDAGVIAKALQGARAALWGAERPRTLVWLALQDVPGGRVLNAADSSAVMEALTQAADERGVTLEFPQWDKVDQAAIGVPDLNGFNDDRIRAASRRYHADAILAGVVAPAEGKFAARWQWLSPDKAEDWQTPAGDEAEVAADGVEVAADRYAARYAIAPDAPDETGVALQVEGVSTLDAYAKLLAYLNALTPVRAVRVERVAAGSVYYSLDVHGTLDNLQSALFLGGLLSASAAPAAGTVTAPANTALRYRYSP